VELRALPRNGAIAVAEVGAFLRDRQLTVDEIFVERGTLDDVFREITTTEQARTHA
jgi:ABC-2 type transport system ATP-binding protein